MIRITFQSEAISMLFAWVARLRWDNHQVNEMVLSINCGCLEVLEEVTSRPPEIVLCARWVDYAIRTHTKAGQWKLSMQSPHHVRSPCPPGCPSEPVRGNLIILYSWQDDLYQWGRAWRDLISPHTLFPAFSIKNVSLPLHKLVRNEQWCLRIDFARALLHGTCAGRSTRSVE